MNEAVLCVDDDSNMLSAYRRFLASRYVVETARGGEAALAALSSLGPFAVVVSDLEMPEMDGIKLLVEVRARFPDTTRMLLTGKAEIETAIQAVNEGNIFRFLTKPCDYVTLNQAVRAGVEQYRLVTAQRTLLETTLLATVRVLGEVLAMANPIAFERATRIRQLVRDLAAEAGLPADWAVDIAATLSQLGCVVVPEGVLARANSGQSITDDEQRTFNRHPTVGYDLLRSIPRLERVAELVANQNRRHAESMETPGAGLLKVALDFDGALLRNQRKILALDELKTHAEWYDPVVLAALERYVQREVPLHAREIPTSRLVAGMLLAADIVSNSGVPMVKAGVRVTEAMRVRLQTMSEDGNVGKQVSVLVPHDWS